MKNRYINKFKDVEVKDYIGEIEYSDIEQKIDLYDAIDILEEKYKTPIILQYFQDLTISQISKILDCNENTVKSYIRRGKKKLYDLLKDSNKSNEEIDILGGFALMDDKGKILNKIDKGGYGPDEETGTAINSIEFIGADKGIKYLQVIPQKNIYSEDYKISRPRDINSLPLILKTSEVGNIKIDTFKTTGYKVEFTYYKEGLVENEVCLKFFDKDENEVDFAGLKDTYVDKKTGRYTQTINLNGYKHNKEKIKSISKISVFYVNDVKLLKDKAIKIYLNN